MELTYFIQPGILDGIIGIIGIIGTIFVGIYATWRSIKHKNIEKDKERELQIYTIKSEIEKQSGEILEAGLVDARLKVKYESTQPQEDSSDKADESEKEHPCLNCDCSGNGCW